MTRVGFSFNSQIMTPDKVEVIQYTTAGNGPYVRVQFWETSTSTVFNQTIQIFPAGVTPLDYETSAITEILAFAVTQGWTALTSANISFAFVRSTDIGGIVVTPTFPSRTLNSGFQISPTKAALVNYSVDILTSVSLAGGASGTVFLEYADDSGFTTNLKVVQRFSSANTGTLVIGLTLNQLATAALGGYIPAGKYVRLRTANTTGTPTYTFQTAEESIIG